MNVADLIKQHEIAIKKLKEIRAKKKLRRMTLDSIKGFQGNYMPERKAELEKTMEKQDRKILDLKVEYRMWMNSIR